MIESDLAELSALATQLDELAARVTEMAERHRGTDFDGVAIRLFEVERSMLSAERNLRAAVRAF